MTQPEGIGSQQEHTVVLYTGTPAMAHIDRLPLEILGEVFLHSIPENHRFSLTAAPLSLCKVCSLWRRLALSMKALWANISFWTPISNTRRMCYPIRYISQWFSLSGSLSLNVRFERGIAFGHAQVFAELFMDMEDYSRSRHLDISLARGSAFALVHFVKLPPGSLPLLESLVLEGLYESDFYIAHSDPTICGVTVFQGSPRLRKLTTDDLHFIYSLALDGRHIYNKRIIPWPQLTHVLVTRFIQVEDFVTALAECSALQFLRVSLELSQIPTAPGNHTVRPSVVLPHLAEIYMSLKGGFSIPSAMDIFTFPALTHLRFRRSQGKIGPILHGLDHFSWMDSGHFLNQLGQLQQLTLVGHAGRTSQIYALLQRTPRLAELSLDIYTDYILLIPTLFRQPSPINNPPPLPLLISLDLYVLGLEGLVPLDHIRAWAESGEACLLQTLSINTEIEDYMLRRSSEELFPETFKVQVFVYSPSRSARDQSDSNLIRNHCMSGNYTMFDAAFH